MRLAPRYGGFPHGSVTSGADCSVFPNNLIAPDQGSWPKHCVTISYTMYVGIVATIFGNSVSEASPRVAHAEWRCAGVCSLTRGNLAARHADCAKLVD